MPKIVINQEDFLRGAAENDFQNNGGYSPEDKSGNIYVKEGVLAPPPLVTTNTAAVQPIIGFAVKEGAFSAPIRGAGTVNNSGLFYTFTSEGVGTNTSVDAGRNYSSVFSDICFYGTEFFVTSKTDIAKFDGDMGTPDYDWWTDTKSGTALNAYLPHQMLVSKASGSKILYLSDENNLKSYDGTNINQAAFAIPSNYWITAIVEYQNKIYIAAEPYYNASGYNHGKSYLYVWDGSDTNYESVYQLEDRVDCMYVFQGNLLLFTSRYMGYWNGINITKLRDLDNQVFKGMITQYADRIHIAQGKSILVYDGQRFSYLLVLANDINAIACNYASNILISSNSKVSLSYTNNANIDGTAKVGTGYWRSRRYFFDSNVIIRKLTIHLAETLASGSVISFGLINEKGTENSVGSMSYANDGAIRAKEFNNVNQKMLSAQLRVNFSATPKQIAMMMIEYEPIKTPIQ